MTDAATNMVGDKIGEAITGIIGLAVLGGFALWATNDFSFETNQEKSARLVCEMEAMKPSFDGRPLSAADAEAYCEKQMQAQKMWTHKQP